VELEELSHLDAEANGTDTSITSSVDLDEPVRNEEQGVELDAEEDGPVTVESQEPKQVRKRKAKLTKLITDGKYPSSVIKQK